MCFQADRLADKSAPTGWGFNTAPACTANPVGAVELCEAAKAVCQANRYRSLAVLGSSYKVLRGQRGRYRIAWGIYP
jgi:hypothetical protein